MPEFEVNVSFYVEAETREEAVKKVREDIKGKEDSNIWEVRRRQ